MNRRLARLLGAGVVASTVGAGCLLGASSAAADPACIGPGYEGCQWDGEFDSKPRHYGDAGYFYDEHGHRLPREAARAEEERRAHRAAAERDRGPDRDRDRREDRPKKRYPDYVDGYFFGLSDYQDDWIRGMLAGSDGGRDFTVPYGHPGHPWGPISYGHTYECRDPGGGAPLDCGTGAGQPPTGPDGPGGPSPAPTSTPEPSRPPTTPVVPPPAVRPTTPVPQALPPPAEGPPIRLILLTFLGSAGTVGTGYLLLKRRGNNPLAG